MYVYRDDGSVDVDGTYKRAQYDNGVAAGSPPDFDGTAYGVKPAPYAAPVPKPTATLLPRLGGGPVLLPGITPDAPKGAEDTSGAPFGAPSPLPAPGTAILRAADAPVLRAEDGAPSRAVDWRMVALGSLALVALWWLVAGRDS